MLNLLKDHCVLSACSVRSSSAACHMQDLKATSDALALSLLHDEVLMALGHHTQCLQCSRIESIMLHSTTKGTALLISVTVPAVQDWTVGQQVSRHQQRQCRMALLMQMGFIRPMESQLRPQVLVYAVCTPDMAHSQGCSCNLYFSLARLECLFGQDG